MRILISCLQSQVRHSIPAYDFWRTYFVNGCAEAGFAPIEVPGVDWAEALTLHVPRELRRWRERTWEAVLKFVRLEQERMPIDLFLGYLYPQQIDADAIKELIRRGIPCVNFFCDNVREFRRVPEAYRPFSLHWVPEFEALEMYRRTMLPHIHLPMPCWIPPEFRNTVFEETEPPTFIGSADILRRELLGATLAIEQNFFVRGPAWIPDQTKERGPKECSKPRGHALFNQIDFIHKLGVRAWLQKIEQRLRPLKPIPVPADRLNLPVFGKDYYRVTQQAAVTIGVNRVPTFWSSLRQPLKYSRLRDIEAPMLGACYITEWTAGLPHLFRLGDEIEAYRTPEELSAKLSDLAKDPVRRRLMRTRAHHRALNDHSVSRSLRHIVTRLGIRTPHGPSTGIRPRLATG